MRGESTSVSNHVHWTSSDGLEIPYSFSSCTGSEFTTVTNCRRGWHKGLRARNGQQVSSHRAAETPNQARDTCVGALDEFKREVTYCASNSIELGLKVGATAPLVCEPFGALSVYPDNVRTACQGGGNRESPDC